MKKRDPDLRWTDEYEAEADSEGWSLFETGTGQSEIQRVDEDDVFGSDAEAVYFVYQSALRHKRHARAAIVLSLNSLKKGDL